jgi:hypothetical protein
MAQEPRRLLGTSQILLGNPLRTEIVQRLRGGHALSSGYRSARTFANDDTADWGSQSQYRGRQLEGGVRLAHKCMCQCGRPGCLVPLARSRSAKMGPNFLASWPLARGCSIRE